MDGFDEHTEINGDWIPPSPSPRSRSFFSAILGYDTGSRESPKDDDNNTTGFTFPGPDKQFGYENGQPTKASSRSGLVERMTTRAGYNAPSLNTDIIRPSAVESPYLTIPPGLSPTSLLDSPVFLSNSPVQPSPTTGKFPFAPNDNGNSRRSMMFSDFPKDNLFEDLNTSSFAFKPVPASGAPIKVNPPFMSWQSLQSIEASGQYENRFPIQSIETDKVHSQNGNSNLSDVKKAEVNNFTYQSRPFGVNNDKVEEHYDEDTNQLINGDNANANVTSEDGYNWRKYGQKQVKGNEYPRSYYKCTQPNCPVKKKVERSQDGHITEIIYKGAHNHPKPPFNRRSEIGSSSCVEGDPVWRNGDWGHDGNLEVTSSTMSHHGPSGSRFESSDVMDISLTFSSEEEEEEEDERATHGAVSLGNDGEGDEYESKRRKIEGCVVDISVGNIAMREPRVVVQTMSEVDILDDGYRWRKYGQKVVKGNPNPRSYYKCTSTGCTVRKHVERASHDLKSVITTYEGKHNHDVPAARNNNNHQSQIQIQSMIEKRHDVCGYGYRYGMEGKMPIHHHQYMLPKGELVSDPPSPYHHQIMNSLAYI
ncbi:probable WRKY transcription factor 2 [Cynara cardunculus var. scolymus]|uniref:DNA-binding WRKY n=1 Tax=Cynara cardunculus var. scolymus TaxID=59895 RepID=A0A118JZS6_CYNCS|nr:probable WRKY transcription factor 2 [Cynara cardunculus var. scolymus]XP_024976561.1 probable WRKY transcription factor 2 [Cynara cardunculus var. scolymus]KVH99235.1 DNA-binding WRKY [Cynara cardunculus var. scolymus]